MTASQILKSEWPEGCTAADPLEKKIVLLGGSFRDYDRHDTPIGEMVGVEALANVIETELEGKGLPYGSTVTAWLLEGFEAVALVVLFGTLRFRWAIIASIGMIAIIAPLCSFISYHSFQRITFFACVMILVMIYGVYEHCRAEAVVHAYTHLRGNAHHPGPKP